jgi:transposase
MTRPLSMDLRSRLVSAVEGGMTRRSAAKRFGIAASTAIKWVAQWHRKGDVAPRPLGGDRRSQRLAVHAAEILSLIEAKPGITLAEIVAHLEEAHGLKVAPSSVWRLLDRHDMTFKKNRARQRAATA